MLAHPIHLQGWKPLPQDGFVESIRVQLLQGQGNLDRLQSKKQQRLLQGNPRNREHEVFDRILFALQHHQAMLL